MRHYIFFIATIAFLLTALFFWGKLSIIPNVHAAPVEKPLPQFDLPDLLHSDERFTTQTLRGRVVLLNIWASWCSACHQEHALLLKIKTQYHVPIYGLNNKDNPEEAISWLQKAGNPYTAIGVDEDGNIADSLDVYGIPETFVIDKQGTIRYRYVGAMTEEDWETILWPLIQEYQKETH